VREQNYTITTLGSGCGPAAKHARGISKECAALRYFLIRHHQLCAIMLERRARTLEALARSSAVLSADKLSDKVRAVFTNALNRACSV